MKKDDSIYLDHILKSLQKILLYSKDYNLDLFLKSDITQDAVIRQLEIIGEVTKSVSKEFRENNPQIPWSDMAGMRDKLIHNYFDVDLFIVWSTVENDVPELLDLLNKIN